MSTDVVWIGFPKGTFMVTETFLKAAKIPYIIILERAAVVQFPELTPEQVQILEDNDWVMSRPAVKPPVRRY